MEDVTVKTSRQHAWDNEVVWSANSRCKRAGMVCTGTQSTLEREQLNTISSILKMCCGIGNHYRVSRSVGIMF